MVDSVIARYVNEVKKTLDQHAKDSMMFPKPDEFGHGQQSGKYLGLILALELLDNVLRDDREQEKKS